jgi:hypothetical protein
VTLTVSLTVRITEGKRCTALHSDDAASAPSHITLLQKTVVEQFAHDVRKRPTAFGIADVRAAMQRFWTATAIRRRQN